jgi:beta-aspartyl-dipeptidase (metallo-type)
MLKLIQNARIFDPDPVGLKSVLIGGGQILHIGDDPLQALEMQAAKVDVHDAQGAMVIPGLIDTHAHLTGGGGEDGPATRVPAPFMTRFIEAGITTVVGVLGTDGTTRTMRDLVATTYGLRQEGLSAYCYTGSYELPVKTLMGSVRDDLVFVDPVIGVGELAISDHRSSQPALQEILRVASDCHVGGMMAQKAGILHLHLGDGARGLDLVRQALDATEIPARTFHPTHVNRQKVLFEEAIELAGQGCTVDVTAFEVGDEGYNVEDAIELWWDRKCPPAHLTVSSDGGGCLPEFDAHGHMTAMDVGKPISVFHALRQLLQRGHAPEQVLPFFTANAADLLRLSFKGRIRAGKDADLVILDASFQVSDVMAGGQWMMQEKVITHPGLFESS